MDGAARWGERDVMPDWLVRRAATQPDRVAAVAGDRAWTYARLKDEAEATARRLRAAGVAPGDRVAVLTGNTLEAVGLIHAVTRLRAVLVPVNTRWSPAEVAWQLRDAQPRLFIHDAAHGETGAAVAAAEPDLPLRQLESLGELPAGGEPLSAILRLDDLHTIIYTSGSTGRPKGVMLTYGNHWWSAMGSLLNLGSEPADRWLAVLPFFHVGGLAVLLRSLIYGTAVVVHRRFDPAAVIQCPRTEGVTLISLVGTMLARMLAAEPPPAPAGLRAVLLGGGPVSPELVARARAKGLPVLATYGLTEAASQVATEAPGAPCDPAGAAGRPLLTARVQVGSAAKPLPPGAAGEILVQGPTLMAGYFRRPQATATALRDGWLHTGDVGFLAPDGYLHVLDRRQDLIVSGGENVAPAEVEAVLLGHPDVTGAAAVGRPHPEWGQEVVAAVALQPGARATVEALGSYCRERLAGYKVPREIVVLDSLPRTGSGKVSRRRVRQQLLGMEGDAPAPPDAPLRGGGAG